ncbi:MAG TPA: glycosyltransferase family 2 protein [Rectinemataceae bacterium]|nr:glycosyltransferase family 2 protein [Rectinemataceae bacterium]
MSGAPPPKISAVILNYRDPAMTLRSVAAFEAAAREADIAVETIIVDNSANESGEALKPEVDVERILIANEGNRGFAAANNQGFARARAPYVLAINNDASATAESLRKGLAYLEANPEAALWAPRLVFGDGRHQPSIGSVPTLWSLFAEYLLPARFGVRRETTSTGPRVVGTVTGAFMLIRREILESLGGFDESYFFTMEDVDLCARIRGAGYRVVYDSALSVVHLGGGSQRWKWLSDPHLHRSRVLFFRKRQGLIAAILASIIIGAGLFVRRLLASGRVES